MTTTAPPDLSNITWDLPPAVSDYGTDLDEHHLDTPPSYADTRPRVPITYSFSRLSYNTMALVPPLDSANPLPLYHITVNMNCFNPLAHITTIRRGNEYGPLIAEFETGITTKKLMITMDGKSLQFTERLKAYGASTFPRTKWIWSGNKYRFSWNCYATPNVCHHLTNAREVYAVFNPDNKTRREGCEPQTLEIMPDGQKFFDDIVVSSILLEQLRHNPAEGDSKKLFNLRSWKYA